MDTLGMVTPEWPEGKESDRRTEAFERLRYLADRGRCGLLVGEAGAGKSHLFGRLADELCRTGEQVLEVDLCGLDPIEFPSLLAARLGLGLSPAADPRLVWSLLQELAEADRLTGNRQVFLLDHLDQAEEELARPLERLIGMFTGSALLAAARPDLPRKLRELMRERAWLEVRLEPLQTVEIARVVSTDFALSMPGVRVQPGGLEKLEELAGGNLNRLRQLSELAGLAAEIEELTEIDEQLVQSVACELTT